MPYSVTKAAQLHLMKCLASSQGSKLRVNAVLPGLLLTEWVRFTVPRFGAANDFKGLLYPKEAIEGLKEKAALKHEVRHAFERLTSMLTGA